MAALLQVEGLASNALGGLSKLQNLSITLQRRWSNVLSDAQRQHIVELFLGLRLPKYLPSAQPMYSATPPLEVAAVRCGLAVTSDARAEQGRPCFCTCAGCCEQLAFCRFLQADSDEEDAGPAATAAEQQHGRGPPGDDTVPPQLANLQTMAQPHRLGVDAEAVAAQHSTTEQPPPQVDDALPGLLPPYQD